MTKRANSTDLVRLPFHGGEILLLGEQVIIKSVTEVFGVDFSAQAQRIKRERRWQSKVVKMTTMLPGDSQPRKHLTIHRSRLAAWLYGIKANMVKKPEVRAALEQYQDEIDDLIDAYFTARMGGASKEDIQQAIQDALRDAEARHRETIGEMRDGYQALKADNADLRAILRSRLTATIGDDEKKALTKLAGKVAELVVALLPGAVAMTDDQKTAEWRVKFADILQDEADRIGAGARAWMKMTAFQAADIRSHLERLQKKYNDRLRRLRRKANVPGPIRHPWQLKLVS